MDKFEDKNTLEINKETLPYLCRLCLKSDDFVVDIFHRLDPNPNKVPLPDRIYNFYQIKIDKNEDLTTNICHRCLFLTEHFTEFRDNVQECDKRLRKHFPSVCASELKYLENLSKKEEGDKYENVSSFDASRSKNVEDENILRRIEEIDKHSTILSIGASNPTDLENLTRIEERVEGKNNLSINTSCSEDVNILPRNDEIDKHKSILLIGATCPKDLDNLPRIEETDKPTSILSLGASCSKDEDIFARRENIDNPSSILSLSASCSKNMDILPQREEIDRHTSILSIGKSCSKDIDILSRNEDIFKNRSILSIAASGSKMFENLPRIEEINRPENLVETNDLDEYCDPMPANLDEYDVIVIDPNKIIESSNDSFSECSDSAEVDNHNNNNNNNDSKPNAQEFNSLDASSREVQQENQLNNSSANDSAGDSVLEQQSPRNVYLCKFCDIAFKTQNECTSHEQQHNDNNPFNCNFCTFHCNARQLLINHIKESHEPERPYVCKICNKGFIRRSDLKKHAIVHTGVRPFRCPVCGKSFSRNTNLTKHIRIHSGQKPHVCSKCSRTFSNLPDLLRHEKTHDLIKPFKCTKCDSSFIRKDKLYHHERLHVKRESQTLTNNNQAVKNEQMNNVENLIGNFITDSSFEANQTQQNILTPNYPIGAPALNPEIIASEMKSPKKRNRIHVCTICAKVFTRKRELQRHSVIHSSVKPFVCRICNKGFSRKDKLTRHEKTHEEKIPCNQCNLVFTKQDELDVHKKIHEINKINTPPHEVPKVSNFLESLQEGITPQLNFYSEIRPE